MSLRLRLTLLYTFIVALTLVAFSGALYMTVAHVTLGIARGALGDETGRLVTTAAVTLDADELLPSTTAPERQRTYVQVRAASGAVLSQSAALRHTALTLPLTGTELADVRTGKPQLNEVRVGKLHLLLANKPIVRSNQLAGVLQVARSLDQQDRALRTLRDLLVAGSGIATLLGFGAGLLLGGTALRPLNRITGAASEIGAQRDFAQRLAFAGPVDEVGRLALTFNSMLEQLQRAYQAQRGFVADAAHELRTPLTSIRGNLDLLQRTPAIGDADREAVLADTQRETERLIRMVAELLALARSDAGQALQRAPVPLSPLCDEVRRQIAVLAPKRHIQIGAIPDVMPIADRDALKQILVILLDNAIKFTPPDGIIRITVYPEGDRVIIAVSDSGPGIEPALLPHVFDRFSQGDGASRAHGAGLGLAIARALADAQHGSIEVDSIPGRGSTFCVSLPCSGR